MQKPIRISINLVAETLGRLPGLEDVEEATRYIIKNAQEAVGLILQEFPRNANWPGDHIVDELQSAAREYREDQALAQAQPQTPGDQEERTLRRRGRPPKSALRPKPPTTAAKGRRNSTRLASSHNHHHPSTSESNKNLIRSNSWDNYPSNSEDEHAAMPPTRNSKRPKITAREPYNNANARKTRGSAAAAAAAVLESEHVDKAEGIDVGGGEKVHVKPPPSPAPKSQSSAPNHGPTVWKCNVDACFYSVYNADRKGGPEEEKIVAHIAMHDKKVEDTVDLIQREQAALGLPAG